MFGRALLKAAELHVTSPPALATRAGLASGTLEHALFLGFHCAVLPIQNAISSIQSQGSARGKMQNIQQLAYFWEITKQSKHLPNQKDAGCRIHKAMQVPPTYLCALAPFRSWLKSHLLETYSLTALYTRSIPVTISHDPTFFIQYYKRQDFLI